MGRADYYFRYTHVWHNGWWHGDHDHWNGTCGRVKRDRWRRCSDERGGGFFDKHHGGDAYGRSWGEECRGDDGGWYFDLEEWVYLCGADSGSDGVFCFTNIWIDSGWYSDHDHRHESHGRIKRDCWRRCGDERCGGFPDKHHGGDACGRSWCEDCCGDDGGWYGDCDEWVYVSIDHCADVGDARGSDAGPGGGDGFHAARGDHGERSCMARA